MTTSWTKRIDHTGMPYIAALFSDRDCHPCPARALCTRKAKGARRLKLQPPAQYLALQQARQRHASEQGRLLYNRRAGIEGTISQCVRRSNYAKHVIEGWLRLTYSTSPLLRLSISTASLLGWKKFRVP